MPLEKDIRKRFGRRLRELRQDMNLSQEELAFRSGLHRTYVGSTERGERNVALLNIERLAKALDVDISDFFLGERQRRGGRETRRKDVTNRR